MSQSAKVLKHLKRGHRITASQAVQLFSCWRLSGRILELRKSGHNIITETVRHGRKSWARYRLAA